MFVAHAATRKPLSDKPFAKSEAGYNTRRFARNVQSGLEKHVYGWQMVYGADYCEREGLHHDPEKSGGVWIAKLRYWKILCE